MKVALRRSTAVVGLVGGLTGMTLALPSPASATDLTATGVYVCYSSVKVVDNDNNNTGRTIVYAPLPGSVTTNPANCPPGTMPLGVG